MSIIVEPLVEIANVCREKIVMGTALANACRAAKNRSLNYYYIRDLDAQIDEGRFITYFIDAFGSAMDASCSDTGKVLAFVPNNDKINTIIVTLDFRDSIDPETKQQISFVTVKAEEKYKFKTKYLKMASNANTTSDFMIIGERQLALSVKN
jgi:hypothetical protein